MPPRRLSAKFIEQTNRALDYAQQVAVDFKHDYIEPEHLLLGLIQDSDGGAAKVLQILGVNLDIAQKAIKNTFTQGSKVTQKKPTRSGRTNNILRSAAKEASKLKSQEIGSEYLLPEILRDGPYTAASVLRDAGISLKELDETIQGLNQAVPATEDDSSAPNLLSRRDMGEKTSWLSNQPTSAFEPAPTVSAIYTIGVCLNGHPTSPEFETAPKFCRKCGEPIIFNCQKCHERIELPYVVDTNSGRIELLELPNYCHECGTAYPWIIRKKEAAEKIIAELKKLTPQEREELKFTLPNIMSETASTKGAAMTFKRLATKAGGGALEMLKEVVTDVMAETAKRVILGQ